MELELWMFVYTSSVVVADLLPWKMSAQRFDVQKVSNISTKRYEICQCLIQPLLLLVKQRGALGDQHLET